MFSEFLYTFEFAAIFPAAEGRQVMERSQLLLLLGLLLGGELFSKMNHFE